ncbi:MAG TPA: hypothetical protein VKM94_01325 [Blastocatellia bacterium]|nr:hypothetical protein [Blastocatellia bacterium]
MTCPSCSREVIEGKSTCPFCGLIFAKWKGPAQRITGERVAAFVQASPVIAELEPESATEKFKGPAYLIGILAALAAVLVVALGVRYFIKSVGNAVQTKTIPRNEAASGDASAQKGVLDPHADFDLTVDSGIEPIGLTWGDGQFLVGSREGLAKFKFDGVSALAPISVEPREQSQEALPANSFSIRALTWNGRQFVGYSDDASSDRSHRNVFTVHDPKTLAVTDYFPAPDHIGGIAWDGSGYWAATRLNSPDSRDAAFLYHLDQRFNVLTRYEPPAIGCQGLAWDGNHLWWVDGFTNDVYVVRVEGARPERIHGYHTNLTAMSGVTYDGGNIWVSESSDKRLRRLNPLLKSMWLTGDYHISTYAQAIAALQANAPGDNAYAEPVDDLLKQIKEDPAHSGDVLQKLEKIGMRERGVTALQEAARSSDEKLRAQARDALLKMGTIPSFDRYQNSFSRTSDDADAIEATAEMMGDKLHLTWRIYYGSQIFADKSKEGEGSSPLLARYSVTVRGGSLPTPIVKEYEAQPGDNVKTENVGTGLGAGRYTVEFSIKAQFIDSSGAKRILSRSIPPLEVGR